MSQAVLCTAVRGDLHFLPERESSGIRHQRKLFDTSNKLNISLYTCAPPGTQEETGDNIFD